MCLFSKSFIFRVLLTIKSTTYSTVQYSTHVVAIRVVVKTENCRW